jgi:threonine dehydratase
MGHAVPQSGQHPAVVIADVRQAAKVLKGAVLETDCDRSRTLSEMFGCEIWLKFENLQFTASFKERGALNRLTALSRSAPRS